MGRAKELSHYPISAVILAAGQAKRMGQLKQIMHWKNSTIIEQIVDSVVASGLNEIIVVVGHRAIEVAQKLEKKPVKIVLNTNYKGGISSSLICGLKAVNEDSEGVIIILGDQPVIEIETLRKLIEAFYRNQAIIVPVYQNTRGNPVIFPIRYLNEILTVTGDSGAKSVVKAHEEDVVEIDVGTDSVIRDIDDISEYKELLNRYTSEIQ